MQAFRGWRALYLLGFILPLSACSSPEEDAAFVGYVEGETVYVSSPQSGWITSMLLAEGDSVAVGDLLFELDRDLEQLMLKEAQGRNAQTSAQSRNLDTGARPEEIAALEAQLQEAKARLAIAKSEHDRLMPLVEQGILAEIEGDALTSNLNRATAQVKVAEQAISVASLSGREALREAATAAEQSASAAVLQSRWRLDQRSIASRVSGRVEMVFRREGEYVVAGSPVLSILPPKNVKIRFFLPQGLIPSIRQGSTVLISADGLSTPFEATVVFIATEAEFTPPVIYSTEARQKLVFMVEARPVADIPLRPGLPVDVTLK